VEANCAKSGWLFKQSKHVKSWNKRYFVLWPEEPKPNKGRLLFYYDSPQVRCPAHRSVPRRLILKPRNAGLLAAN
jgi:hypothetical protein